MKRNILLFIIVLLFIFNFTGCSKKLEATINEVNTQSSFDLWVPIHPFTLKGHESHNEHPMAIKLAERTGIEVNYINPPLGQEKEQLNLVLSSQDLPDAIWYDLPNFYKGGIGGAIKDGVLINMNDLIYQYAPNYIDLINQDENVKRDSYTDSGIIKSFGSIIPDKEMRGLPFYGPIINRNYLEQAGLNIPETINEWEVMLRKFKDMDTKVPLSWENINGLSGLYDVFSSAYGVPSSSEFYKEGEKIKYGPIQNQYKEFLILLNSWYEQGLIDPDYMTRNFTKHIKPMLTTGDIGATIGHSTYLNIVDQLNIDNNKVKMTAAPYPVLKKGDTNHFRHHMFNVRPTGVYITTKAKDPKTIVEWVDYLYSKEGNEFINWGEEGITFKYNDKGEKEYTDLINNNPDGIPKAYAPRQVLFTDLTTIWDWEQQRLYYNTEEKINSFKVWQQADYANMLPDSLTFTIEESEEYISIMGDINTYVEEMCNKFIMGIEPIDNKFDEFVDKVMSMEIEKAIQLKQRSYQRYLER